MSSDTKQMKPNAQREAALFQAAIQLVGSARASFLDNACGGDGALRQRLEALLAAHEQTEGVLAETAFEEKPTIKLDLTDAPDEAVGQTLGRYKLLERVGEGGCGVVYVAEQTEPVRRRVALKVIKLGMDTKQVVARFEAERQALAMMDHPNIAKVLDAGTTDVGRPYFVMELVRGIRITDYCDQANLSTKERLDLFIKVCQAIQHAHQKGIIHRDIKPSNILVTLHDGVPVPKVIDFGIAKATEGRLTDNTVYTQLHQFIGTPAYMSPEQAEMSGLDIDTRSDIYSLGVLLYELLAGSTPFDAKELMALGIDAMRKTIREKEPPRPSTRLATLGAGQLTTTAKRRSADTSKLLHQLKGDLDWIVMKCLEKDRTRRYETANGLAADLKRHLDNEPVLARPPSTAYKFQKAFRRNKATFTAGALVAVALVAGIAVSSWQAIAAHRARTAEHQQRLAVQSERNKAQAAEQAEKRARLQADAQKAEATHLLYVANMNLAQQAWDQNNIGRLRQLLDETQDSPYRGFEWDYWQLQTHLAVMTLHGHLGDVYSAAYSPDGQRIVTGGKDGTAKVWDAVTGHELTTFKSLHDEVRSVAFSPDGRQIVAGSKNGTVKLWEAVSGRELITFKGHGGQVESVAFSPDGQQILSFSDDGTIKLWEAANSEERLALKVQRVWIASAAFSPDGQRIVAGSGDGTAHVWDAANGRELLVLSRHNNGVSSVAYSPDGRRIVTGSQDQTAKIWDATTGEELLTFKGHSLAINSAAFSPNGQRIVTGSTDGTARLWDAGTGKGLYPLKGHSSGVHTAGFSPNGQRILTASFDGAARIWEAGDDLSLDQTGARVLTLTGLDRYVRSVAFSPDGQRILTGSSSRTAKIWDANSGRELLTLTGHRGGISAVALSRDGQWIVTGSEDQTAKVWAAASGKERLTLTGHRSGISSAAFSVDSHQIVTGSGDKTAKVWDTTTGRELLTLTGHSGGVTSVAFSPDGHQIITGSADRTAKVWEAATGRELLRLKGHGEGVTSVAFSPDGRWIVTGSHDRTAKVWDAASGRELLTLAGHSDWVNAVAFSPDGQRIATVSDDGTAKLWEAASGRELLTLRGHRDGVFAVAFSPDGRRIVTSADDGTMKVWTAAKPEQVAVWQREERAAAEQLAAVERERKAE
jgi:eukaryotic-like serine/threonine-protein kinase